MFECSFSKPAIAALVAWPSVPRPAVAKTMVCLALAGTWLDALELLLLLQPPAASPIAAATATTASTLDLCSHHVMWPPPFGLAGCRQPFRMMDVSSRESVVRVGLAGRPVSSAW